MKSTSTLNSTSLLGLSRRLAIQLGCGFAFSAAMEAAPGRSQLLFGHAATGPTIPANFAGLSYEAAQLANPAFFSASNKSLVALFREISPSGVLRIGGGTRERIFFSETEPTEPAPFEVFGPDTSKTARQDYAFSVRALENLRAFLDACGWTCLYCVGFGRSTPEKSAAEAVAVNRILGPRLMAFVVGNEPDSYGHYRPKEWSTDDYIREWNQFHAAVAAAVPGVKFAGPDISNKLAFLNAFAAEAPRHPDVVLLTGHYYAMGPAGTPEITFEQFAKPDPSTTTMKPEGFAQVAAAMKATGLPYRMSEGSSCWNGGQVGLSDSHAAALWCADAMLRFAQFGWSGVNWHGGGYGHYAPIVGTPTAGFTRRPEFFGILFAQLLNGGTFVPLTAKGLDERVTAYVLKQGNAGRLAVINRSPDAVTLDLPVAVSAKATALTAPALDSKDGTALGPISVRAGTSIKVPAHTALLYSFKGRF
jgi:hypothetical protein